MSTFCLSAYLWRKGMKSLCGHAKEELLSHLDCCYMLLHLNMAGWNNNQYQHCIADLFFQQGRHIDDYWCRQHTAHTVDKNLADSHQYSLHSWNQ